MNDPIGDLLTRIRNGITARKPAIIAPNSDLNLQLLQILYSQGYITNFYNLPRQVKPQTSVQAKRLSRLNMLSGKTIQHTPRSLTSVSVVRRHVKYQAIQRLSKITHALQATDKNLSVTNQDTLGTFGLTPKIQQGLNLPVKTKRVLARNNVKGQLKSLSNKQNPQTNTHIAVSRRLLAAIPIDTSLPRLLSRTFDLNLIDYSQYKTFESNVGSIFFKNKLNKLVSIIKNPKPYNLFVAQASDSVGETFSSARATPQLDVIHLLHRSKMDTNPTFTSPSGIDLFLESTLKFSNLQNSEYNPDSAVDGIFSIPTRRVDDIVRQRSIHEKKKQFVDVINLLGPQIQKVDTLIRFRLLEQFITAVSRHHDNFKAKGFYTPIQNSNKKRISTSVKHSNKLKASKTNRIPLTINQLLVGRDELLYSSQEPLFDPTSFVLKSVSKQAPKTLSEAVHHFLAPRKVMSKEEIRTEHFPRLFYIWQKRIIQGGNTFSNVLALQQLKSYIVESRKRSKFYPINFVHLLSLKKGKFLLANLLKSNQQFKASVSDRISVSSYGVLNQEKIISAQGLHRLVETSLILNLSRFGFNLGTTIPLRSFVLSVVPTLVQSSTGKVVKTRTVSGHSRKVVSQGLGSSVTLRGKQSVVTTLRNKSIVRSSLLQQGHTLETLVKTKSVFSHISNSLKNRFLNLNPVLYRVNAQYSYLKLIKRYLWNLKQGFQIPLFRFVKNPYLVGTVASRANGDMRPDHVNNAIEDLMFYLRDNNAIQANIQTLLQALSIDRIPAFLHFSQLAVYLLKMQSTKGNIRNNTSDNPNVVHNILDSFFQSECWWLASDNPVYACDSSFRKITNYTRDILSYNVAGLITDQIPSVARKKASTQSHVVVVLKYLNYVTHTTDSIETIITKPAISEIVRVSKPSRRVYTSVKSMPHIKKGFGLQIISTPRGIMSDVEAKKYHVGGEIICRVF